MDKDIKQYIEQNIEQKINQLFDILPPAENVKVHKMIYEYTIYELYQGTIQTAIDILNDITELNANKTINSKVYRKNLIEIIFAPHRKIFIGIIFVLLSFIMYFIDSADA